MQKSILVLTSLLFLFSCTKDHNTSQIEDITEGSKWNLEIGSSQEEAYNQLQTLGTEKQFDYVSILNRDYYQKPEDVKDIFPFYDGLALVLDGTVLDQVYFALGEDQVDSIYNGQTQLAKVNQWPMKEDFENPIVPGDSFEEFYQKLEDIYQDSYYSNYLIYVQPKPLAKAFDPSMKDFSQWGFQFSERLNADMIRENQVILQFDEDGKLGVIRVVYQDTKG